MAKYNKKKAENAQYILKQKEEQSARQSFEKKNYLKPAINAPTAEANVKRATEQE